jgi:hypothetical protein
MVQINPEARLVETEAEKRMAQSMYPELKRIVFSFRHAILTLYGVVSSFHVRQIAQELIQDIKGIEIIDNQLVVATKKKSSPIFDGKVMSDGAAKVMSDGAGSTGLEEPVLGKIPGEGQPEPASLDAQTG